MDTSEKLKLVFIILTHVKVNICLSSSRELLACNSYNRKMLGNVINTISTTSAQEECFLYCLETIGCQSVNYKLSNGECSLLSHAGSSIMTVQQSGYLLISPSLCGLQVRM